MRGLCRGLTVSTLRAPSEVLAIMGLGQANDKAKIGIARVSALRVISISLAHTFLSFYFDGDMCKLETNNVKSTLYTTFDE